MDGALAAWGRSGGANIGFPADNRGFEPDVYTNQFAFVARRASDGALACWGSTDNGGGTDCPTESGFVAGEIWSNQDTFVARRPDGQLRVWGGVATGRLTTLNAPTEAGFGSVYATSNAFCARREHDGSVVCWGAALSAQPPPGTRFGADIRTNKFAFIARRTTDSMLVGWGESQRGGGAGAGSYPTESGIVVRSLSFDLGNSDACNQSDSDVVTASSTRSPTPPTVACGGFVALTPSPGRCFATPGGHVLENGITRVQCRAACAGRSDCRAYEAHETLDQLRECFLFTVAVTETVADQAGNHRRCFAKQVECEPATLTPTSELPSAAPSMSPSVSPSVSPATSEPATSEPTTSPSASPTTTQPSASPTGSVRIGIVPDDGTEDPCSVHTCSDGCEGLVTVADAEVKVQCGWDAMTNLCRAGHVTSTSEADARLESIPGECPQQSVDDIPQGDTQSTAYSYVVAGIALAVVGGLMVCLLRNRRASPVPLPAPDSPARDQAGGDGLYETIDGGEDHGRPTAMVSNPVYTGSSQLYLNPTLLVPAGAGSAYEYSEIAGPRTNNVYLEPVHLAAASSAALYSKFADTTTDTGYFRFAQPAGAGTAALYATVSDAPPVGDAPYEIVDCADPAFTDQESQHALSSPPTTTYELGSSTATEHALGSSTMVTCSYGLASPSDAAVSSSGRSGAVPNPNYEQVSEEAAARGAGDVDDGYLVVQPSDYDNVVEITSHGARFLEEPRSSNLGIFN